MHGLIYDIALKPAEILGLSKLRTAFLRDARGNTLELGAGTGLNFAHYPKSVTLTAIDLDADMLARARIRARSVPVRIIKASAQDLPFADSEFDTVVATLVFCSIEDPGKAMLEAYRVLKPGGQFLLLEHVRKDSPAIGKLQDLLTPLWSKCAGGCHLNRRPSLWIRSAGFEIHKSEKLWGGFGHQWLLEKRR
jgi:ubiquinone/menaquinone biosynthesis C-methylase UbiE